MSSIAIQYLKRMGLREDERKWTLYKHERITSEVAKCWDSLSIGTRTLIEQFNHQLEAECKEPLLSYDIRPAIIFIRRDSFPQTDINIVVDAQRRSFVVTTIRTADVSAAPISSTEYAVFDLDSNDKLSIEFQGKKMGCYSLVEAVIKSASMP